MTLYHLNTISSFAIQSAPLYFDKTMAIIYSFQRLLLHSTSVYSTVQYKRLTAKFAALMLLLTRSHIAALRYKSLVMRVLYSFHAQKREPTKLNVLWNLLLPSIWFVYKRHTACIKCLFKARHSKQLVQ